MECIGLTLGYSSGLQYSPICSTDRFSRFCTVAPSLNDPRVCTHSHDTAPGIMADGHSNNNHVPVLLSFSAFSRPSSVPVGSGYEVLIQKFLSIYGRQIDLHRKFMIQLYSDEWAQYIDLPKGFLISEKCKLRFVPLETDVRFYRFVFFIANVVYNDAHYRHKKSKPTSLQYFDKLNWFHRDRVENGSPQYFVVWPNCQSYKNAQFLVGYMFVPKW